MCKVIEMNVNGRVFHAADIKEKCIRNIIEAAGTCDYIDKIVLFGSSITNKCRDSSDVDIAVFGNQSKAKCLSSAKYRNFTGQLYKFDDYSQSYDILYFRSGSTAKGLIERDIASGELIYVKE